MTDPERELPSPPPAQLFSVLRTPPNAMEVYLLGLALLSAVTLLFTGPRQFSVDLLLGPLWMTVWAIMLIFGGLTVIAGLFWRGRTVVGIALQQLGYTAFAIASLARGVAQIGVDRVAESPVIFGFALAATIRVVQLEVRVRRVTSNGVYGTGTIARWRHGRGGNR